MTVRIKLVARVGWVGISPSDTIWEEFDTLEEAQEYMKDYEENKLGRDANIDMLDAAAELHGLEYHLEIEGQE